MLWNNLFQSNSAKLSLDSGLWCPSRSEPTFLEDTASYRYQQLTVRRRRRRRETENFAGCSL